MSTTVTVKGQVTIPKPVRDLLGIKPGSEVDFNLNAEGAVVLTRAGAKAESSRFRKLLGHAGPGMSTDEVLALTREAG
ncbi:MAG: AbrB/MazE/SpoVT family DNA-binding domain-containing protein [Rhizobiaceae bacterium]